MNAVDRRLGAVKAKRSKYGNVQTTTGDGVKHASKKQSIRWVLLRQWEREGKIRNLRREVEYRLTVNGQLICKYIADHVYEEPINGHVRAGTMLVLGRKTLRNGSEKLWFTPAWEVVVEDVKSAFTRKDRVYSIKRKLMKACHGITIKEV